MPTAIDFSWIFPWAEFVGAFNAFSVLGNSALAVILALLIVWLLVSALFGGGKQHSRNKPKRDNLEPNWDGWLTVKETSAMYGQPKSTLRAQTLWGRLSFGFGGIKYGEMYKGRWMIPHDSYVEWHNRNPRLDNINEVRKRVRY